MQHDIFFSNQARTRKLANTIATRYCDRLVTTSLFGGTHKKVLLRAWNHPCHIAIEQRMLPKVVPNQELRHLRHRLGCKAQKARFAYCFHCNKGYTYEEMVNLFVRHTEHLDCIADEPALLDEDGEVGKSETNMRNHQRIPRSRMLHNIIQFQQTRGASVEDTPVQLINATYQHHMSTHMQSCFKCTKFAVGHTCGPMCECRFRLPDLPRPYSQAKNLGEPRSWYNWQGEETKYPFVQFLPKRGTYDLFQNVSWKAVSESKLSCNTNLSLVTPGPLGQYQFKYQHKATQKDDTAAYREVETSIKGLKGRTHEEDMAEATRLIRRAAFAHNSTNVIGGPMANFLLRNHSRFYFSHEFVYCPLKDLVRLLNKEKINVQARLSSDGSMYFENQAFHYLCRASVLNSMCVKEYYEQFYFCPVSQAKKKRKNSDEDGYWRFENNEHFIHPSSKKLKKKVQGKLQFGLPTYCAKRADTRKLVKVTQWLFPDTCSFRGDLLTCPTAQISLEMERYSQHVLTLFSHAIQKH